MFKYIYEKLHSLWRVEHLKFILEEVAASGLDELIDFTIKHPRTLLLYRYLTYSDRLALAKHLYYLHPKIVEPIFSTLRPYLGPFLFGRFYSLAGG